MEVAAENSKATEMMRFEETELRLGLPGNGGGGGEVVSSSARKRGFSETVDLQLNLSSVNKEPVAEATLPAVESKKMDKTAAADPADPAKPPAKAQVVGWPPVRSFRKNMLAPPPAVKKSATTNSNPVAPAGSLKDNKDGSAESEVSAPPPASFVKVSMDGAPYLRKVDLKMYGSYKQLSDALSTMFNSFSNNEAAAAGGLKDFMSDGNNNNNNNNSDDYVPTYEDKDGDWMLVGDVPWEMFVVSCKRLRIMKGKDAIIGLAPRGMEKRKNRA